MQDNQQSSHAKNADAAWLQGHWKGEAFGGVAEEFWSPPTENSMVFVFRLVNGDSVSFYEIGHIIEKEETILMQLKHFDGNLRGWEKKDETVDFKLVRIEDDTTLY